MDYQQPRVATLAATDELASVWAVWETAAVVYVAAVILLVVSQIDITP